MFVRRWQVRDFRARRRLLEPEDFAIGGSNPPPSDRVSREVWHNLMALPDDVVIRTTNEHGSLIAVLNEMHWSFLEMLGDSRDRFGWVLLDVEDEFGAALVFALQGFYRQGAASLRTVVELIVIGTYCSAASRWPEYENWRRGVSELAFGRAADRLPQVALVGSLEAHLSSTLGDSLFRQRTPTTPGGWCRRLYSSLSNYAHSRPSFANADIWASNGPIYLSRAFLKFASMFTEVYSAAILFVRLGRAGAKLPAGTPTPHRDKRSRWSRLARTAHSFLG